MSEIELEKMSKHIKTFLATSKKYRFETDEKKKKKLGDTWDRQYLLTTKAINLYKVKKETDLKKKKK